MSDEIKRTVDSTRDLYTGILTGAVIGDIDTSDLAAVLERLDQYKAAIRAVYGDHSFFELSIRAKDMVRALIED